LLNGSQGMREWLMPRVDGDRMTFFWRLVLIVGRKAKCV
jgi:hypothetical protein